MKHVEPRVRSSRHFVRPLSSNVHGEEIHRMGTLRGWIFARERRDTFLYPLPRCLGFDLLFLPSHRSHPENGSIRRRIPERKCFYSKGRKDRRVNPLTRETAFLFLLPFRIVSYGNSISTFLFRSILPFYAVLKYQKKSIFVLLLSIRKSIQSFIITL